MKLAGQNVSLLLTDDGKQVLAFASVNVPQTHALAVAVEESEDMGVWVRVPRKDGIHFVLVRWEYILAIDIQSGMGRVIGMRA